VQITFSGQFVDDPMADVLKLMAYFSTMAVVIYSRPYLVERGLFKVRILRAVLFALLGMMVMISANHFLSLYIGLELLSLSLYAMVALQRDSAQSTEAAMKYFVLGALASGFLLYGMSCCMASPARWNCRQWRRCCRPACKIRHGAGVRPGVPGRRSRLQARRRALPHVGAGHLSGRTIGGDPVHRLGAQAGRICLHHALAGQRPASGSR
jgi:hypothetical protein